VSDYYDVLCDQIGVKRSRITDDMSLCLDLGVAGEDGWRLIERLHREFDVKFEGFDSDAYFGPEVAFNPFFYLYEKLVGRQAEFRRKAGMLTVGHLREVCQRGAWFEPVSD